MRRILGTVAMAVAAGAIAGSMLESASARGDTPMALSQNSPRIGAATIEETLGPSDEDAVYWAQDRFREAGLSLPDIHVSFHADAEPCEGARGGHRVDDGRSRVFICITEQGPARGIQIKRVLLHEFAHAWDHLALRDDIRSDFTDFKDFPGWSFEVAYDDRASEAAAEIITWGLMDRPILLSSLDDLWSWEEMLEGYRILTGSAPPHGYVWTFFAASHDVYASTESQVEMVKEAWERSENQGGRLTESIEVRFSHDPQPCGGATTSSELIGDRLHIRACPGSESQVTTALVDELTGQ